MRSTELLLYVWLGEAGMRNAYDDQYRSYIPGNASLGREQSESTHTSTAAESPGVENESSQPASLRRSTQILIKCT